MEQTLFKNFASKPLKVLSLVFFLGLGILKGYGQGDVEVIADTGLQHMVKVRYERKLVSASKADTFIVQGYRVQVYFTNDRNKAYSIRDKAIRLYPEMVDEVYVVYQSPNYKVRIGNFLNEEEVRKFEKLLANDFENVFIVRDKVVYIKNKVTEDSKEAPED